MHYKHYKILSSRKSRITKASIRKRKQTHWGWTESSKGTKCRAGEFQRSDERETAGENNQGAGNQ